MARIASCRKPCPTAARRWRSRRSAAASPHSPASVPTAIANAGCSSGPDAMRHFSRTLMAISRRLFAPGFVLALFAGSMAAVSLSAAQMTPGPGVASPAAAQDSTPRPPAATLTRPATATRAPDADGFLQRWLVLEPIRTNGQLSDSAIRTLVGTTHFPDQLTTIPRHGDVVTVGEEHLTWHAVDTSLYNVNLYHFAYALNKPTSNVLFWAVTVVDVPREMTNVRLAIGSNAASVWWVNGE